MVIRVQFQERTKIMGAAATIWGFEKVYDKQKIS